MYRIAGKEKKERLQTAEGWRRERLLKQKKPEAKVGIRVTQKKARKEAV